MGLGKKRVDVCRSRTRLHSPQIQGLPAALISARIRIQVNLLLPNLRWREPINFCSCSYIPPSISLFFSVCLGGGWISCGGHAYELHEMQIGVMMRPHDCMVAHAVAHFSQLILIGDLFLSPLFPLQLLAPDEREKLPSLLFLGLFLSSPFSLVSMYV